MDADTNNVTVPGKWYFWFPCKGCQRLIPFTECTSDATVGGDLDKKIGPVPCSLCSSAEVYQIRDLVKAQAADYPLPSAIQ
jgi:hypothetical protein